MISQKASPPSAPFSHSAEVSVMFPQLHKAKRHSAVLQVTNAICSVCVILLSWQVHLKSRDRSAGCAGVPD